MPQSDSRNASNLVGRDRVMSPSGGTRSISCVFQIRIGIRSRRVQLIMPQSDNIPSSLSPYGTRWYMGSVGDSISNTETMRSYIR